MSFVVPESETPETDALTNEAINMGGTPWAWSVEERKSFLKKLFDSHERIEHRLSLAQTEIKGLTVQITRLEKDLACAQENFHVTNQAYVKADVERTQAQAEIVKLSAKRSDEMLERGSLHMTQMREQLDKAQSRIAELEKLLGRWLTGPHVINAPLSLINETKYAALKDRA